MAPGGSCAVVEAVRRDSEGRRRNDDDDGQREEGGKTAEQGDPLTMRHDRRRDSADDRIGPERCPQENAARLLALVVAAGWVTVTWLAGGLDLGRPGVGRGSLGALLAVGGAATLAVAMLVLRPRRLHRLAWVAIGGMAGYAAWSALSLLWAPGPDLAWIAANRSIAALGALLIGVGVALVFPDPMAVFAKALAAAAGAVVGLALVSRVVPVLLAPSVERPRLSWGIGAPNALALVAVMVLPGAALALGSRRPWERNLARAGFAAVLLTVAMTQSRTGVISLALMLALVILLLPHRPRTLAATGGALAAVVPAVVFAFTAPALTRDPFLSPPGDRVVEGLVLGLLIGIALVAAVVFAQALEGVAGRTDRMLLGTARRRWGVLLAVVVVLVGVAVVAAVREQPAGDGAGRIVSLHSNNRGEWWREAREAALDAPVVGHGAGSFPHLHLRERRADEPSLQVRDPHQIVLGTFAELGLVGLVLGGTVLVATGFAVRRLGPRAAPPAAVTAVFLVHSQLDYTWSIPATAMAATAAAGVIVGSLSPPASRSDALSGRRKAIGVLALPVLLAVWASAVVVWSGQSLVQRSIELGDRGEWAGSVRVARQATDRNPLAIQGLLQEARAALAEGDRARAIAVTDEATSRHPQSAIAWSCRAAVVPEGPLREAAHAELRRLSPVWIVDRCLPGW